MMNLYKGRATAVEVEEYSQINVTSVGFHLNQEGVSG